MSKLSEGEPYRPGKDTGVAVVVEYSHPAERGCTMRILLIVLLIFFWTVPLSLLAQQSGQIPSTDSLGRDLGQKQGKTIDEIAAELEKNYVREELSRLREEANLLEQFSDGVLPIFLPTLYKQLKPIEVFGFLSLWVADATGAVGEPDMGSLRHALVRSFKNDFGSVAFRDFYREAVDGGVLYPKGKALPSPEEVSWRKWMFDYVLRTKIELEREEDAKRVGYIDCWVKTAGKEYGVAYNVSCRAGNLVSRNNSWRGEALGLAKHYELTSLIREDLKKLVQQFAVVYFRAKSEP